MGVLIGGNDMHTDFGMILTDLSLEMPEVKTKYQTLPLENGSIDLSEVVTGRPVYGLRTGTTAVLNSGDEIVSPTFTASETGMTVALNGGAAYSIAQVGKAVKIPELLLLPGANNVTVTGTGNVILTWREGVL